MSNYKIGSIVPLSDDSKDARMVVALKEMATLTAERDQLRAELKKVKEELAAFQQKTFERAIAIASGCQIEYGGGYKDQREADAFYHGMTTVENCLRARQNPTDYQAALVEQMGLRELKREAEIAKEASHGRNDAEERASEAEERCAAEWEKHCGQALRLLAQVTKFEWDQDGSHADEVREHIQLTIESLEKQVLSLRAEHAAAKGLLARIHRDGGHHTEAVGFAQSVADADSKVSEWLLVAAERDQLAAHVERLVGVLRNITKTSAETHFRMSARDLDAEGYVALERLKRISVFADSALAATPAQSLAAHDAALLEQVKARLYALASKEADQPYGHDMNPRQWAATCLECAAEDVSAMQEDIKAEADRIEKEAQRG